MKDRAVRIAIGVRPFVDDDGLIHLQLLDNDTEPFAEFVCDLHTSSAVVARMLHCQEGAAAHIIYPELRLTPHVPRSYETH